MAKAKKPKPALPATLAEQQAYIAEWKANLQAKHKALAEEELDYQRCRYEVRMAEEKARGES